jgi:hypothetical protein
MVVSKRVNLHLPPNAIAVLDRLATERGLTRTATTPPEMDCWSAPPLIARS